MPQPTHPAGTPPLAQMAPTPGVTPDVEAPVTKPQLSDDIDPVRLARLHPEAFKAGMEAARAEAMKAGNAALERSAKVVASQQVPVSGQEGQPPPAATPAPATKA
jgi:hypothetical protein